MKSWRVKYIPVILVSVLFILSISSVKDRADVIEMNSAETIGILYADNLNHFLRKIEALDSMVGQGVREPELIPAFLEMREVFKTCEFLLCYIESDEVRRINGANLITNAYHHKTPMEEKHPHGLQVIEDLLFNPEEGTYEELKKEIVLLREIIATSVQRRESDSIVRAKEYNIVVWDAFRLELFRIETLGITGFDVPESLNSLPETMAAMNSLEEVVQVYEPVFKYKKAKKQFKEGVALFRKSRELLQQAVDFDSFDRLEFITEVLHPLEKWTKQVIDDFAYTYPVNFRPIDNRATFLYDTTFLNTDFFAPGIKPESVRLGKKLFNDPLFSADGSRSCASCHISEKGMADGMVRNTALDGSGLLKRNTPTLLNAGFQTRFFYDSRAKRLEIQVVDVIHNPLEMGGNVTEITARLQQDSSYAQLFKEAYNGIITKTTISNALADYVRSLVSFNSRFDKYVRGDKSALNESEKNGFNIFSGKAKCATCHFAPLFNGLLPPHYKDNESEILGVPVAADQPDVLDDDLGKFDNTKLELHKYAFKTTTIRNVGITAPYMHNGIYSTLEEVVDFYDKGGGLGQGIDLPSQTLPDAQLQLTETEKKDLVNFMKTLTDNPQE